MTDSRLEDRVRAVLRAQAEAEVAHLDRPGPVILRARRRLVRNVIAVGAIATASLVGSFGVIRSVARSDERPPAATPTQVLGDGSGNIAFVDGTEVHTIQPDGSGERQLTHCVERCGHISGMAWSPDGSRLVFSRFMDKFDRPGADLGALYLINADGSGLQRLTDCQAPACTDAYPVWSPDGARIAFMRQNGSSSGIYVIGADGSGLTLVKSGSRAVHPSWSPDGSQIAYDVWGRSPTIRVVNTDGTGDALLAVGPQIGPDAYKPVLSADWSRIAYCATAHSSSGYTVELWVSDADGSHLRRVYTGGRFGWDSPLWSPDGTQITFAVQRDRSTVQAFVINADGSGLHGLGRSIATPIWSPEGTRMALVGTGLVVFSSDGSGGVTLIHPTRYQLAWQPSG